MPLLNVINNGKNIRLLTPKGELEGRKMFYMLTLLPKGVQKIIETFLIEEFFYLPPVSTTLVVHLELRISPQIFRKKI
jgi:hypothetical protein